MSIEIKKWISDMPEYVAGRTIEEIKKEYGVSKVYKLASNENLYGLPPGLEEKIASGIGDIYYYPDSRCEAVREKLAGVYGIPKEQIIMGNGSDQIIGMVCDSIIGPGDNAVIADPTFSIYEQAVLKCGGSVAKVPLDGFRQDIQGMLDAVDDNTRIVFMTNPLNPTGANITTEEFDKVIGSLDESILLVMDEAYYEFCPAADRVDTLSYIAGRDNLVILRTFSKIFGLAGLRIGYGFGSLKVIDALNRVRLPFNVSSIAQAAAVYALDYRDYADKITENISKQKQIYYNMLDKSGIGYAKSYTNFLLIETGKKTPEIVESLLKEGYIVRPGKNLGFPEYIRVTIATEDINKKFLDAFTRIYKGAYNRSD